MLVSAISFAPASAQPVRDAAATVTSAPEEGAVRPRTLAPPPSNSRAAAAQAGLSLRDKNFLIRAADGGLLQIELGQVAASKGANPQIRQDGTRAVQDFDRAERELDSIAEEFGIRLSHRPPAEVAKLRQSLEAVRGAALDRNYIREILREDAVSLKLFTVEAHSGQNPVLVQFAREMLPRLTAQQQRFVHLSRNKVASDFATTHRRA